MGGRGANRGHLGDYREITSLSQTFGILNIWPIFAISLDRMAEREGFEPCTCFLRSRIRLGCLASSQASFSLKYSASSLRRSSCAGEYFAARNHIRVCDQEPSALRPDCSCGSTISSVPLSGGHASDHPGFLPRQRGPIPSAASIRR